MSAHVTQHAVEVFVDQDVTGIDTTVTGGAVTQHVIEVFLLPNSAPDSVVTQHVIEVWQTDTQSQETGTPGGGGGQHGWVALGS
jgi:ABC-type methionine transport system permease subunit